MKSFSRLPCRVLSMPARRIPLLLFGAFFALYFIWGSTY
ncbi:drug/metabolite exporter YedA, partial [Pseudomonas aeruginosa]|nr:drug/metabolite exporter YedA [Pseudomonas aeruginosa]